MDASNPDRPIIMTTGARLYNRVSSQCQNPKKVIPARELSALFQLLPKYNDSVLFVDLSLFDDDVTHPALQTIFKKAFELRIIVYTSEKGADKLYKLFEQGVRGFCHTTASDEFLIKAIKAVDEGELWIGRKLTGYLMSRLLQEQARKRGATPAQMLDDNKLTLRESEIAILSPEENATKSSPKNSVFHPTLLKITYITSSTSSILQTVFSWLFSITESS